VRGNEVRKEFGLRDDDVVVGIASRFSMNKGHEIFLRAARRLIGLRATGSGLKFLVAGGPVFGVDAPRETTLRKLCDELGLTGRVVFTGLREDMPRVYAAMDIFVIASFYEACSRTVLEAMACGKPVVGTNIDGTPEMVADGMTGLLVPAGDAERMAAAIGTLAEDKDKRLAMGIEARKRVEKEFDIKAHVKKTECLYTRLLERHKKVIS
jgi:glycosyltransferase involved in cell wall biosynthesis